MKKNFTLFMLTFFLGAGFVFAQTIRYVKPTGTGNGSTWANASGDLQAMIDASSSDDEIWVAAGTYLPTVNYPIPATANVRYNTFKLKNGVHIYGGFDGTDNVQTIAGRNLTANKTILSGDIGTLNVATDNAYHVVMAINLTNLTILDGLTISDGYGNLNLAESADGVSFNMRQGAALTVRNAKLKISNVNFVDNYAMSYGGAINMQTTSEVELNTCVFQNNRMTNTGVGGAAIYATGAGLTLNIDGCEFINNRNEGDNGSNNGGAIYYEGVTSGTTSTFSVTNSKFNNNYVSNRGGAFYLDKNITVSALENLEFTANQTKLNASGTGSYYGGAVYILAGVTVQKMKNLKFKNNKAEVWGGALLIGASSTIATAENFFFEGNEATTAGGAIFFNTNATIFPIINATFHSNSAKSGGAIYFNTNANSANPFLVENAVFYDNEATDGGALYLNNSYAKVVGATFYKNSATANGGAIFYNAGSTMVSNIYNSLFVGNTGGATTANLRDGNGTFDVYNSAFNGTGTGTDKGEVVTDVIETDIFKSVTPTDNANFLRLKEIPTNPAIDKGLNSVVTTSTDLAGNTRTINATALAEPTVDMGAYENQVTTLPVTLLNFAAKANGKTTALNWITANETNNNYFIVERSADGKTFKQLTKVSSKGNGAPYSYTDYSPLNGDNYYRLSQVDLDGTIKVIGNQVVKHTLDMVSVTVYPNPVVDKATLSFGNVSYTKLQLVDSFGRLLQSQAITKQSKQTTLDLSIYPKGIYYVKLANNNSLEVKKIIK